MINLAARPYFTLGPYLWINGDDTYQLAQTIHGLRMEIITDAPPPEEEEEEEVPPPPYVRVISA